MTLIPFHALLQRSRSDKTYSLTFYEGNIDEKSFPIRGVRFSSQASLRRFLDEPLRRKDSQKLIQDADSTDLAISFYQVIDGEALCKINKVAGSIL